MKTRVETKEILRTETVTETKYIAFDGTEFDKENDCFDYEAEQILKRDDIVVFDKLTDCSPLFCDPYTDDSYIWIMPTTEEAKKLIDKYYNEYNENIKVNHIYGIRFSWCGDVSLIMVDDLMADIKNFFKIMGIEVTFNEKGDK